MQMLAQSAFDDTTASVDIDEDPDNVSAHLTKISAEINERITASVADQFTFELNEENKKRFVLSGSGASQALALQTGYTFDHELDGRFNLVVRSKRTATADVSLLANSLTIVVEVGDIDEKPYVRPPYKAATADSPGREIFLQQNPDTKSHETFFLFDVFRDPEGRSLSFKPCLDDFKVIETIGEEDPVERGNSLEDANTSGTGRERHCLPNPDPGADPDANDVTRNGNVVHLVTVGQSGFRINAVQSPSAQTNTAVITFRAWVGTPVTASIDADAINLSEEAKITVYVKTGVNNPPRFAGGATGFRATTAEMTLDDEPPKQIGPNPSSWASGTTTTMSPWNARDDDNPAGGQVREKLTYRLEGTPATPACRTVNGVEMTDAVALGQGCAWLNATDLANGNVAVFGRHIDYEDAARNGGSFTITLVATDGYPQSEARIPLQFDITDRDEPIKFDGPIREISQLVVGRSGRSVNLNNYFEDPDGTPITFDVLSTSPTIVSATLNGSILTVNAVGGVGTAEIVVTAIAAAPSSERRATNVRVQVRATNSPPSFGGNAISVAAPTPVPETETAGYVIRVPALSYIDPDGDTVTARVINSSLFEAVVDPKVGETKYGGEVGLRLIGRLDYETNRQHVVQVQLNDGWDNSLNTIGVVVLIADVNEPPRIATNPDNTNRAIPDQTVSINQTNSINALTYFVDPDGGRLLITAATTPVNSPYVTVTVVGQGTVQFTGIQATDTTPVTVTVTAQDTAGLSVQHTFRIFVSANTPPRLIRPLPNIEIVQSGGAHTISLIGVFTDPDVGDSIARYEERVDEGNDLVVALIQNETDLVIIPRAEGSVKITIVAVDTRGGRTETSFVVQVLGNTAPVLDQPVPSLNMRPNSNETIVLTEYFSDPDGDTLTFVASSNTNSVAETVVSINQLFVTAKQRGTARITVTATDPDGEAIQHSFLVSVINEIPELEGEITLELAYRGDTHTVDIAGNFSDADGDPLTYTVTSSDTDVATASLVGSNLTVTAVGLGTSSIVITATDPYGAPAEGTVEVTIENQIPQVAMEIMDHQTYRQTPITIDLSQVFSDPDGDDLTFTASVSNTDTATAMVSGSMLTVNGLTLGMVDVRVTAQDAYEGYATEEFKVTILNRDPITIAAIEDITTVRGVDHTVDLSSVFADEDGDELTFEVTVSASQYATATINGSTLVFRGIGVGQAIIRVIAMDAPATGQAASTSFRITVENQAPVVVQEIDDAETHRLGVVLVDLADVFNDPDGDPLTYTARAEDGSVALVRVNGAQLSVTGRAVDTTTITVTARDEFRASVSTTFEITVENRAPTVANAPLNVTVNRTEMPTIDISSVFDDEDNDRLEIEVQSSNPSVATATLRTLSLTIQPLTLGSTEISITATDPYDASVSTMFSVEVENIAPKVAIPLANVTTNRQETVQINIGSVFVDDDGDDLTLSAESANPDLVTVSVADTQLTLMGMNLGTTTITVTGTDTPGASASTMFNVTVENLAPTIGSTIEPFQLEVGGDAVSRDVTGAFADDGPETLVISVESLNEAIATASIQGTTITVMPVSKGLTSLQVTATDAQNATVAQSVPVSVSEEELKKVATTALASFSRAVLNSLSSTVGARLMADADGLYSPMMSYSLDDFAPANDHVVAVHAIADDSPFALSSDDGWSPNLRHATAYDGRSQGNSIANLLDRGFALKLAAAGDPNFWSVWGGIDRQSFEGANHEGNVSSFYFGGDMTIRGQWTLGLAVGRNTGEADYTFGTATQTMENELTSILPYARMSPSDRTTVYGAVGFGSGSLETTVIGQENAIADLKGTLGIFGGRQVVYTMMNGLNLAVVGDYGFANLETDEGGSSAHNLVAEVSRFRGGLETSLNMAMGADGSFVPFVTVGFRADSGDGDADSGVEIAGGLRITNPVFSLDANFRTLATYGVDDYSESGFSIMAVLNPSAGATGLSVSLAPSWGANTTSTNALWHDDYQANGISNLANWGLETSESMKLDSTLGYGFFVYDQRFVFTPFIDVQTGYSNLYDLSLGMKLIESERTRNNLGINLKIGQDSQASGTQEETVRLDARMNF